MKIDIKVPTRDIVRNIQAYEAALEAVKPYVGELPRMANDSAGAVYRRALRAQGHDVSGITKDVAEVVWNALRNHRPARARAMATDAASTARLNEMFPNWNRLHRSY